MLQVRIQSASPNNPICELCICLSHFSKRIDQFDKMFSFSLCVKDFISFVQLKNTLDTDQ